MRNPVHNIFPIIIAKKKNEENVLKKLGELKAFSEETAQKPKLTDDETKAVERLKKQKKIIETEDGRWYISN